VHRRHVLCTAEVSEAGSGTQGGAEASNDARFLAIAQALRDMENRSPVMRLDAVVSVYRALLQVGTPDRAVDKEVEQACQYIVRCASLQCKLHSCMGPQVQRRQCLPDACAGKPGCSVCCNVHDAIALGATFTF
jgi:hypothetical protein